MIKFCVVEIWPLTEGWEEPEVIGYYDTESEAEKVAAWNNAHDANRNVELSNGKIKHFNRFEVRIEKNWKPNLTEANHD